VNRLLALIAVTALLVACGGSGDDGAHHGGQELEDGSTPRLVVVGDSLTAGRFATTQEEAFPDRAAAALRVGIATLGVPGATTAQLAAQTMPRGSLAVVEAGTNDFINQTPRRQFADDYRALLAKVTAASPGAKLVCLTIWAPNDAPGKIRPASYNAAIRRACTTGKVANISPLYVLPGMRGPAGRSTFLGPGDDFHPNSAGHGAIAQAVESQLR
jgi:acyl-CoA thioesterase I